MPFPFMGRSVSESYFTINLPSTVDVHMPGRMVALPSQENIAAPPDLRHSENVTV